MHRKTGLCASAVALPAIAQGAGGKHEVELHACVQEDHNLSLIEFELVQLPAEGTATPEQLPDDEPQEANGH